MQTIISYVFSAHNNFNHTTSVLRFTNNNDTLTAKAPLTGGKVNLGSRHKLLRDDFDFMLFSVLVGLLNVTHETPTPLRSTFFHSFP